MDDERATGAGRWTSKGLALRRVASHPRLYARHYAQKLAIVTLGRLFVSRKGRRLRARMAGPHSTEPAVRLRTAIVAHVFYPEILDEILECREVLPGTAPLLITAPHDRVDVIERRLSGVPDCRVYGFDNRGRDIAPFIALLNSGVFDAFDCVLKLHTKRSPHLMDGDTRRRLLFAMLCGERNATMKVLSAFEDGSTGMVGWGLSWRWDRVYWMNNRERVMRLARDMRAPSEALSPGFFEGSMFWFRPAALGDLRQLHLRTEDFEEEARQLDGTLHHAVERAFTISAWTAGFEVRDLRGRVLPRTTEERASPER